MRNSQTLNLLRSHVCRTRHYLCTKRTWPWPKRAANRQDSTPPPPQKDHAKLPEFFTVNAVPGMHVQDSRHLERSMDASVVDAVHSCSCKGQPHANDNPYSAVRLFPQANTTDNSQTTRIQRCSSRTYAPISPSIRAHLEFVPPKTAKNTHICGT